MFGYPPCWPRNEVHYALLHSRSSLTFEKLKPVKYMLVGIDCDCGQTVAWLAILRGHNLATFACHTCAGYEISLFGMTNFTYDCLSIVQ